jgi:hypothetical protein
MQANRDPQTPEEWREAVMTAEVMLRIESARQYGLITGGPAIDVERCQELIERGRAAGHVVTEGDIDAILRNGKATP